MTHFFHLSFIRQNKNNGEFILATINFSYVEVDALGNKKVRFQPVSSFETEHYFDAMVDSYSKAVQANIPPLILIPVLIHDFCR